MSTCLCPTATRKGGGGEGARGGGLELHVKGRGGACPATAREGQRGVGVVWLA